jgi:hypothetical protein
MATLDRDVADANRKAAEATQGTAKALADAAGANERARQIELEGAAQRERAAKAEKDLLEIQTRLAPRTIGNAQEAAMVARLSPYAGQRLAIIGLSGSDEIAQLARRLAAVFTKAGVVVVEVRFGMAGRTKSGISMEVLQDRVPFANAVLAALGSAGLATNPVDVDGASGGPTLYIWPK